MKKPKAMWVHKGEEAKTPYQYRGCGLDDVWLLNGYDVEEIDGERAITVRNLDGLLKAIAQSLVKRKKVLNGKEIRFLRLQLDLTQSDLARAMGCDSQQVARYEKGENKMPGPADRILRMLVREHYEGKVSVREILAALDALDAKISDRQEFSETPEGAWKAAA